MARVRLRCLKKALPSPRPLCAPEISPGKSASTGPADFRSVSYAEKSIGSSGSGAGSEGFTTPRLGISVVNGYAAMSGDALVTAFKMDDLPALGNPTRPISATTRISNSTWNSSPGSPFVATMVASSSMMSLTSMSSESFAVFTFLPRFSAFCARLAAKPPAPPCAINKTCPCLVMSPSSSPDRLRRTTVPGGTSMYTSSCFGAIRVRSTLPAPAPGAALPWYPFLAFHCFLSWNSNSESHARSTRMKTFPPAPPSAGSAAGSSMNFFMFPPRLNLKFFTTLALTSLVHPSPSPPVPPHTVIMASSKKRCLFLSSMDETEFGLLPRAFSCFPASVSNISPSHSCCFTVFVVLEKVPPPCLAGLAPSTGLGLPGGRVLLAPRVGFPAVPAPPPPRACATTEIRWSTAAERRRRLGTTAGTRGVEPGADT
mmetsp:Transcript_9540/g.35517  ORF Transcript_9540/g.35517 Transcript_9540/m.35517 type:complete len:428 (+) Transcript_9540:863-2146(+)